MIRIARSIRAKPLSSKIQYRYITKMTSPTHSIPQSDQDQAGPINTNGSPTSTPSSSTKLASFQSFLASTPPLPKRPLIWIDCEMTGLDVLGDDVIIEICCIITDEQLNIVGDQEYETTVYCPKSKLDSMDEWCTTTHTKSGLIDKVLAHPEATTDKIETELLNYIQRYVTKPRVGVLAGNSIHMDKFFMMKQFPKVIDYLHYRVVDVSTIMEFGQRHAPTLMSYSPGKKGAHTAKADILESIEQLKWYRQYYFKSGAQIENTIKELEAKGVVKKEM
ncbi:Rex2 3'-5' RNA exonuclease [Candida orthopsilosis Co 90-125]|uniref:Rex2 3'-5' RNA exonuclease n=1 Tax=Candida orthopsilosis (strain 90-125) TaxID=1136231 RepID=H8XA40_CANO9|nr:Rex2 3'-5' RNA exonuclease [Candida orthopsilosis Co 90-125]CCG25017.1 Rex2 3'-5' RNA exonuclease [Candida orthopsilosis Co 90-125]